MRTHAWLFERMDRLLDAPADEGRLALVVRRPGKGEREVLAEGELSTDTGLVGDSWLARVKPRALAEGTHLQSQVNVMSSRMVGLLSDDPAVQALAGDQLYVDLDISHANLPAGAKLAIGADAVLEVSVKPHAGCQKFTNRFGVEATEFVNSEQGRAMRLRGFNARVLQGGVVRPGDIVRKL